MNDTTDTVDICENLYFYVSQKNGTLGRQSF